MADFETAGYGLLTFQHAPPVTVTPALTTPLDKSPANTEQEAHLMVEARLPSLSSLMSSLVEIEGQGPSDAATHQQQQQQQQQVAPPVPSAPTEFHLFNDLPAEIRLKIWHLTFLPRQVELRPTRAAENDWGRSNGQTTRTQWQSGCTNPAALSVSAEARAIAQAHYRIAFPLAQLTLSTTSGRPLQQLLHRTLYLHPATDTVCLLGHASEFGKLTDLVRSCREADPQWRGLRRLALSVRGWGYGGSAAMLRRLGKTVLAELDQLVLFMYGDYRPPAEWAERGAAAAARTTETAALDEFRTRGNRVVLVPLSGSQAWYEYQIWSAGKGRQFWDASGNIIRVGRNQIEFMELEFHEGW